MASSAEAAPRKLRLDSVDLLRGAVMVTMALDHVRDYFSNAHIDPTELAKTTPALFFTRWITHFCAPVFVFLAGTGSYLSASRGKPKRELARFLATRGLWLVLLEITWVRFGWMFDLEYRFVGLQVIWAIGVSMIVLAALQFLPARVVGAIGVIMIASHNLLDGIHANALGGAAPLWRVTHEMGPNVLPDGRNVFIVYPLVPWIGVMAAGYGFGELLRGDSAARRKRLAILGGAIVLLFVALRASNLYGDPHPWSPDSRGPLWSLMSFLNCEKYPPSLLYLAMTLGPSILILAALDRVHDSAPRPLLVFGRVPLFYYLIHIPLIHAFAIAAAWAAGKKTLDEDPWGGASSDHGFSLPIVYVAWVVLVALLYPACRWFAALKARRSDVWLSYL